MTAKVDVVVVGLPEDSRWHLTKALTDHAGWCRTNGIAVPADIRELLESLARGGRARPKVGVELEPSNDALMLLSYPAAAGRLNVSARTVRRLVALGKLPAVQVAGCKRIKASDLATYVENLS